MSENKKTVVNRKERRKSWWSEQRKKDKKREGLRKSTLTVRPALYTETKIITQDDESKPRLVNHRAKKIPKVPVNGEKNNKTKLAKTKPASEESPSPSPSKLLPQKYVLFVGNLPYTITKEQLEEHFRKTGGVKAIRIPKGKGTGMSKGFAYVELKDRISHGIALRLHHTTLAGRKINVEFTSHGNGKSEARKEKLKLKNLKLAKMKVPVKDS
ncbi:uncharacterized protein LOC125647495 [Ostrea edulis]|uniref:uncharacterized protein LOC125647495 n=1 Tax=Ostrea edulis TaxID=37623 RepID=UPI0024AFD85D|nr:uncharacterized protein LOC125647495 [Ostrea edulis]